MNGKDAISLLIGFAAGYYALAHFRKTGKGY